VTSQTIAHGPSAGPELDSRTRWMALVVLCLGNLMIVLDTTIVNVALPSIRSDLGFSESSLAWVVNAYLLTFGGFLLLGGRLGDLFGPRRLFLAGIAAFTTASVACGLAGSATVLVAARAVQGLGGAVVSAVALSLVMNLFTEPGDRAKAMGFIGFVAAGGGSIGVLLGGVLTNSLDWHWIFLVNAPIGVAVYLLSLRVLPAAHVRGAGTRLDIGGAVTVTAALMLAVYAIVNGNEAGWTSLQTVGLLAAAAALLAVFLRLESAVDSPLVPLALFRRRNVAVSNIVGVLWAAAMFAWFFLSALYLQLVLHYSPLQVGLAFLPSNLVMATFSLGLSAKLVMRFGIRTPLMVGLLIAAAGLVLFARAPVDGHFLVDVLPAMLLLGFGAGMAFNPVLLAAMSDVEPQDSGLASGVVNTSFMMGGALGLAVLASLAAARSSSLVAAGEGAITALNGGYHLAFIVGAVAAAAAGVVGGTLLRIAAPAYVGEPAGSEAADNNTPDHGTLDDGTEDDDLATACC
jgi:EmrB/QacA subfamily drug resistance transporter